MSYVRWKVVHYDFNGTNWSGVGTEITDFHDPMITVNLGAKKDSFSIKLNNPYGQWNNFFAPNDKIEISRVTNSSSFTGSDIVMVGVIRNIPTDSSGSKDIIRIDGYNLGEAITTGIVFYDSTTAKTPMQIIKGALESLQLQNSNFTVTWSSSNPLLYKKDTTTSFPTYTKKYFYKPLSKVIEEMLSDVYTQDGAYIWWVDRDNKLQIRANTTGTSYSYDPTTDFDTVAYKDGRDVSQVRNFIILKGGLDPSNKPIQVVYQEYTSISKHGMKYFFAVSDTVNAQNLNQQDVGQVDSTDRYPTSYPFETAWVASYTKTVEGVSVVEGSRVTIPNTGDPDTKYREVLREEIRTRLMKQAKEIAENTAFGKLQIDLSFTAGSKGWLLGDRIQCTIPRLGVVNKELRVKEIQKTTELDTYSLEEDLGTI